MKANRHNCVLGASPILVVGLLSLLLTSGSAAALPTVRDLDARAQLVLERTPTPAQAQMLARLQADHPDWAARLDTTLGTVRNLSRSTGYLTAARHDATPMAIALEFVNQHAETLGLSTTDLVDLEVTDVVFTRVTGATHIYFGQRHAGLPVYNGQLHVNINRDGRVISVNNLFAPRLNRAVASRVPQIDAATAVAAAVAHLDLDTTRPARVTGARGDGTFVLDAPSVSTRDIHAELMWLPITRDNARLVWRFQLFLPQDVHWFDFTIDAESSKVWTRFDWIDADSYRALEQPIESPDHSANPPPNDGRTAIIDPQDTSRSPLGWHNDGSANYTIMRGNNVHAFDDLDGNNQPPATEPDCGAGLVCDFDDPIDFSSDGPTDYTSASVTNLFYWANTIHDIQYQYGFDEAAGNFQTNNFANGGAGGDEVTAFAQKSGAPCPNNAFFGTPGDGSSPNMIMCLWTPSNPQRDFSFDNGVVIHEYGHGISNRLVGGPNNVGCLGNSQQPGEGLSDCGALAYTGEVGDAGTDVRGSGTYILGQPLGGPGVRTQPYSTDPAVNTHSYESISGMSIPHGVGEVWAQVAWEAYWALVDARGFDADLYDAMGSAGNQRMMLNVNEGLKNTACSPTFTEVRDGIIQAATDNHGGEDVCTLWEAFAAFGLGTDAVSGGSGSTNPTNGFTLPGSCLVNSNIFLDGFESGDVSMWSSSTP